MTVTTSSDTVVTETVDGTLADVAVGDTVMVVGEEADGTVAATAVTDSGTLGETTLGGPGSGALPSDMGELPEGMDASGRHGAPRGDGGAVGRPGPLRWAGPRRGGGCPAA